MDSTEGNTPRKLPWFSRLIILLGGIPSFIGWAIFAFGMIFFWVFVMNSEWIHALSMGQGEPLIAEIVDISPSSLLENRQPINTYTYRYTVDGNSYEGLGYLKGNRFDMGQEVEIFYRPDKPAISKMAEARSAPFGRWVIFLAIFPLVGLGFILYSFRKNMKSLDLLECGQFASGTMTRKEVTNTHINHHPVYKVTYAFEAEDGKTYESTGRTHHPHLLQEGTQQRIIYAQKDPSYSVLFETIPFKPKVDEQGRLYSVENHNAWVLILPTLTILGNFGYLLYRYFL